MPEFFVVALVLILLAASFVVFPLLMNHGQGVTRQRMNVNVFKERIAELEKDFAAGQLPEQQYQTLKIELERRLLDDAKGDSVDSDTQTKSSLFRLVIILTIPVMSFLIYQQIGARADWQITQLLEQTREKVAAGADVSAERVQLLRQLESRLQQQPNNPFYLMLLGNIQQEMGNYDLAVGTFQQVLQLAPDDPSVMSVYVQAKYLAADRVLTDEVRRLANATLQLNPDDVRMLGMMGVGSFEAGEFQLAIDYWQRLQQLVGPFSPNGRMIGQGIEQARMRLASQNPELLQDVMSEASLAIDVSLDERIQVDQNSTVFVYARAVAGPRMPLAVARLSVADLPIRVTLNDSMAMAPGMKLSSFEEVEVIARISKNGIANRGPGDIEGVVGPVKLMDITDPLTVVINTILP